MKTIIAAILLLATATFGADYYVATNGNDSADGSIGTPFATVSKAFDAIIALNQPTVQKNIYVRGGNYYNTFIYPPVYSRCHNTTLRSYPGEKPYLFGGQLLTGWTSNGDGTWKASLGTFSSSITNDWVDHWEPRTLLVNGTPARWAQYPAPNYSVYPRTDKLSFTSCSDTSLVYTNAMENSTNGEVVVDNSWNDTAFEIYAINTGTKTITARSAIGRGGQCSDVYTYAIRNTKEGLYQANMFFWDKTNNTVVYQPTNGVDPNTLNIVVPTQRYLFYLSSAGDVGVSNLVVKDIAFAVNTVYYSDTVGAADYGSGVYNSAIYIVSPTNCVFDGVEVFCIAGGGVVVSTAGLGGGNIIRNCVVHDIGTLGFGWSGYENLYTNNLIYNCGLFHQSGAGLLYSSRMQVVGNTFSNIVGAAIGSVSSTSGNTNVLFANNLFIKCMKSLRDMGVLYGHNSTNISIIHNAFFDTPATNADSVTFDHRVAIYLDAESSYYTVASNITHRCGIGSEVNESDNTNTLRNNVFINTDSGKQLYYFQSGTNKHTMAINNIWLSDGIVSPRIPVWNVNHNDYYAFDYGASNWVGNIVYSVNGSNAGNPASATSADPKFVKVPTSTPQYLTDIDLTFQAGSPAPALGIQPLSIAGIGYNGGLRDLTPPPPGAVSIRAVNANIGSARSAP